MWQMLKEQQRYQRSWWKIRGRHRLPRIDSFIIYSKKVLPPSSLDDAILTMRLVNIAANVAVAEQRSLGDHLSLVSVPV